ncbi:hypothetical protein [Natronococcus wangiae]|uniref:hypothetical protein n=1 Tax=Natronococcus wangiae TaxID=3068275 RepID=UPI00273D5557|nr:hypothetical protein [Natronococcus sp. AD5]
MSPTDTPSKAELTADFERDLTDLIATAFARGATVERTWKIPVPAADAPDWTVTIQRNHSDEESPYEPKFIEE